MKSIDHNFDVSKELGLEDLPNEIWKDIQGYEGFYQISNYGRIKSLEHFVFNGRVPRISKERILRPHLINSGYKAIRICVDSKRKSFTIHRLVASAFIPNPENKREIDHINGIKTDNRVSNLRWVTPHENMSNPLTVEKVSGVNNHRYGKGKRVINLTTWEIFKTQAEAARFYDLDNGCIYHAIKNRHKSAGCYWGYYKE